ncbi:hypothetical protein T552_00477 [Pneumocystis carinii B80]|uniref:Serine/threonine-protein kinase n=1 Tax=Pneumocystis carinii (strain B80) TaxID=1408658 RepID=A0A0W4ZQX1_PNEC8|nr:hypothetical protein T552_00477 [Pneumocystis carinii B80]KTW30765.1 hypothetical protein T552_00477 [Pneumocystis carinii B80]
MPIQTISANGEAGNQRVLPHDKYKLLDSEDRDVSGPREAGNRGSNAISESLKQVNTKPSNLCFTPPVQITDKKKGREYTRSVLLGEGGFARCFLVTNGRGSRFAAKVIAKTTLRSMKNRTKLFGEIKIHQSMDHPSIVKFIDCFEDTTNVYLILELCENKTLMDMLRKRKRFTEPECRFFLLQVLGAVKYMHSRKVIHRDLKLGNLFLDENMNIKIGDFGLAALLISDDERKKTICGTPNYIAPEVLFGKQDGHSFEVDLWAVGIIMYAMLIGKPPFQSKEVKAIYKNIRENRYVFPENIPISLEAKDLIGSLLDTDPLNRPCIDEIAEHPFFHTGYLPTEIPVQALLQEPVWPKDSLSIKRSQSSWNNIASWCGIGKGRNIGGKEGQTVSMVMEVLENENILPTSLSYDTHSRAVMKVAKTGNSKSDSFKRPKCSFIDGKENLNPQDLMKPVIDMTSKMAIKESYVSNEAKDLELPSNVWQSLRNIALNLDCALRLRSKRMPPEFYDASTTTSPLFINKWVDYSNKYGLGYQLSNGSIGVYFNDSTSLILSNNEYHFDYITQSGKNGFKRRSFTIERFPSNELDKKVYLLKYFKKYMVQNLFKAEAWSCNVDDFQSMGVKTMSFMTNYFRTKHAIIFRLSNQSVQFNFVDHCKLILSDNGRIVRFIDSKREFHTWPLGNALEPGLCDDDVSEKFKFAKEVLLSWADKMEPYD